MIVTKSPADRYPSGLHVGSTYNTLIHSRKVDCETDRGESGLSPTGNGSCLEEGGIVHGEIGLQHVNTEFIIFHHKISEINLSMDPYFDR
jgi:hypothetical protein